MASEICDIVDPLRDAAFEVIATGLTKALGWKSSLQLLFCSKGLRHIFDSDDIWCERCRCLAAENCMAIPVSLNHSFALLAKDTVIKKSPAAHLYADSHNYSWKRFWTEHLYCLRDKWEKVSSNPSAEDLDNDEEEKEFTIEVCIRLRAKSDSGEGNATSSCKAESSRNVQSSVTLPLHQILKALPKGKRLHMLKGQKENEENFVLVDQKGTAGGCGSLLQQYNNNFPLEAIAVLADRSHNLDPNIINTLIEVERLEAAADEAEKLDKWVRYTKNRSYPFDNIHLKKITDSIYINKLLS